MQMEKPAVGNRLASMLLDHFCTCIILMAPIMPFIIQSNTLNQEATTRNLWIQLIYLGIMVLYFLKDSFGARSIAKRVTKLQVVDNRTGKPASVLQCFFRNLTTVIWPVEVIITFFNTQRRLGDYIAGTRVINYGANQIPAFEFE